MIAEYGLTEINGLRMHFIADKQLKKYKELCKELELIPLLHKGAYEKFLEAHESNPDKCVPTVEENQRKKTDDNLGGVFG